MRQPQIIGHRGVRGHVAENTIASVTRALEMGVDGVEIDVFRIRSGEVVVFHDETLERLTDGSGRIEDKTWAELQKLRVLDSYPIPRLEEVLKLIDGRLILNIELKGSGTASPVYNILEKEMAANGWHKEQFLISSFKWEELEAYRELDKEMAIGILTETDVQKAIAKGVELKAKAVNPDHALLTADLMKAIKETGMEVWPWTVNDPSAMERMIRLGVDAIITDHPERIPD